jgi:predicted outer membrane lipoprotein
MQYVLVICEVMVVTFLALHDWLPLGKLNNMVGLRAVDSTGKLALSTVLSTLPFAAVLVASVLFASSHYPNWLLWWLWGTYLACAYGILRAWWIPYLCAPEPDRAQRYLIRFAGTHGFLPVRNGMRPDTLHVAFHSLVIATLVVLGLVTFVHQ